MDMLRCFSMEYISELGAVGPGWQLLRTPRTLALHPCAGMELPFTQASCLSAASVIPCAKVLDSVSFNSPSKKMYTFYFYTPPPPPSPNPPP
jgi:hypothetical protein